MNAVRQTAKDTTREHFDTMTKPFLNVLGTLINVKAKWIAGIRKKRAAAAEERWPIATPP